VPASRSLDLNPADRAALAHAASQDPRPYYRERCAALLKIADGTSVRQVAQHGLLRRRRPETVADWLHRYQATGLDGLVQQSRRPRGYPP
jgi:transposase